MNVWVAPGGECGYPAPPPIKSKGRANTCTALRRVEGRPQGLGGGDEVRGLRRAQGVEEGGGRRVERRRGRGRGSSGRELFETWGGGRGSGPPTPWRGGGLGEPTFGGVDFGVKISCRCEPKIEENPDSGGMPGWGGGRTGPDPHTHLLPPGSPNFKL